ncbi:MAG: hypothetical protein ACI8UO_002251 [Verrucomicrobiales bacterium]
MTQAQFEMRNKVDPIKDDEERELDSTEFRLLLIYCVNGVLAVIGLGLIMILLAYLMNWDAKLKPADDSPVEVSAPVG